MLFRSQSAALDRLLASNTAQRLLDLPSYVAPEKRKSMISLSEVYSTLQSSIWSELSSGTEIDVLRRSLQREHLKRLQGLLLGGSAALPSDALSLARLHATRLQQALRAAKAKGTTRSIETQAHLAESLDLLTQALRATMQRS